ncbi:MAG TPA: hypothetical protein QGH56_07125, partial [Candidatus Marinimicrobia bacterium]|nr:hypothetical protein [Candidatus Neomarinimicrobiota bacterium]
MKYSIIIFLLIKSVLISQVPIDYKFSNNNTLNRYENITEEGLNSNSIVDIYPIDESYLLMSTGSGLSYVHINDLHPDSVSFGSFNKDSVSFPRGGAPALAVRENIIVISGLLDTTAVTGEELMGTGISYSIDEGENWDYLHQPIDEIPESGQHHTISWGGQDISVLAVTTEINNISYDLAIGGNYIYAANWAGGLRRYGPLYSEQKKWEIIPLPMDSDSSLICGAIDLETYELNPNDPVNSGNHNHKGFSVYVDDNAVWTGTANGINKGIIEGDCINWEHHYTSTWNNISGNWVIGFTNQKLGNSTDRLWAITWAGEGNNEKNALSYTDDGGENWQITSPAGESEKVYNLYANENRIWAATNTGLYVSKDGEHWERYSRPIDTLTGEEILSETVLAVYNQDNWLWVGTFDGISIIESDTITTIHRFWKPANPFSAYP